MTARSAGPAAEEIPAAGAVDIWSAVIPAEPSILSALATTLSSGEWQRALRFRSRRDRERFMAGRGFLRSLLATYLGGPPEAVPVRAGPHGKPEVIGSVLAFNLAHAGDLVVCAVGDVSISLGIDIERIEPMRDEEGAARMMLSPGERTRLEELPGAWRLRRLYETWTCKEAVLKAVGTGLDRPLDGFEILFAGEQSPRLVDLVPGSTLASRYWLRSFEPVAGFVGAIASAAPMARIRYRRWQWR